MSGNFLNRFFYKSEVYRLMQKPIFNTPKYKIDKLWNSGKLSVLISEKNPKGRYTFKIGKCADVSVFSTLWNLIWFDLDNVKTGIITVSKGSSRAHDYNYTNITDTNFYDGSSDRYRSWLLFHKIYVRISLWTLMGFFVVFSCLNALKFFLSIQ